MVKDRNILIRGRPRSGKSTLIQRLMQELKNGGKMVGGISTPELREGKSRVGFEIVDIFTGRRGILAHQAQREGAAVGKYRVNLHDLNEVGTYAIDQALERDMEVVIIDEIGKMELVSKQFQAAVWKALDAKKVVGTIGLISHPFVSRVFERSDLEVIDLTPQTREEIYEQVKILVFKKN
ncbi:MAG: DUF2478 domain-containing protein [Promethearchaeota archaeon]|nr:MAG: DUF2478 domain-containing protein [Candidatus Lokiarchaeota archaeon]